MRDAALDAAPAHTASRARRPRRYVRLVTHVGAPNERRASCRALGPLFVRMRRVLASKKGTVPARATLRRLEENGITSVEALRAMNEGDFKKMGIRRDLAGTILGFVRRSGG